MAITGSYSTSTGVNLNLVAYYSYAQDPSANTSTVTVTLKLSRRSFKGSALSGSYLSVNGQKSTYTYSKNTSSTTVTEDPLIEKTVTIQHDNTTGKANCPIKGTFVFNGTYGGKYIGTLTIDETLVLNTIQRASTFSAPSSINTGSDLTITISPANSTFKHKVDIYADGTYKCTIPSSGYLNTNSPSYNIPHSWFPNSTSGNITVYVLTYTSSGTHIANTSKTITANVPSNIIPKIKSVTATVVNGLNGRYVQGKSSVKVSVSAEAGEGSTINSYTIKGASLSYTGSSSTATSGIVSGIGTSTYIVTVSDKRGRPSAQSTVSITIQPYTTPRIAAMTVQRCKSDGTLSNDGTCAKVSVDVTYSSIDGQNTFEVNLSNSKDSSLQTILTQDSGTTTYTGVYGSGFLISENYEIQATIKDRYTTGTPMSAVLKVATRPFNMAKYGNGIAIGGMSSVTDKNAAGLFEVNWDTNINANETVTGDLTVNGSTTLNNLTVNGSLTTPDAYRIKYQVIPDGADLDDAIYRAPGFYRSQSSTNSITNKPSEMNNGAFELVVTGIAESSYCTQTVKDISSNTFYVRTQTSWSGGSSFPSWTAWSRILTSDIPSNKYYPSYGINMNNSDLIGANAIYFGDKCDSVDEGINFLRHDGGYDVLYAADGGIFLRKNQSSTPVRALTDDLMTIRRGTCTLNVSSATTVNFSSALPGVPTVMLTPLTTNSGVIAAKVRSVTASGFTAIIGGSGISDTQFAYLAIWTLQS